MGKKTVELLIPDGVIIKKIYYIRNQKVMLDADLAELYGVETKRLKEQVKRNMERFPERYMFELTIEEAEASRSHFATLKRGENIKYLPLAFTEQGVMMLSNVLKSKRAIEVSIRIIDVFILLRETLTNHTELRLEIEHIKKKVINHDKNIELVFQYLDELLEKKEVKKPRVQIGYKIPQKTK
ncbi:MAG: ORF6N domain-containing protein [Burkholderiales bacterium]|nr:ORF6N domain-containing protein [Bacteroidia bacterium]